jgi:hypothetical protein
MCMYQDHLSDNNINYTYIYLLRLIRMPVLSSAVVLDSSLLKSQMYVQTKQNKTVDI